MNELKLRIAGIVISVTSPDKSIGFKVDDNYRLFITDIKPDAVFRVYYGSLPECELEEEVFDSGTIWSLYQSKGKYILKMPSRIAILDSDFKSGNIYIEPSSPSAASSYPLDYPLDEVLMINWLSMGWGIIMHACGVCDNGRGIIFTGTSGSGKSTIADLWKARISKLESRGLEPSNNIILLSDDRIIIRKIDGRFWIYGTPWHGDAQVCSPEKAPLERIFFLNPAPENRAKGIERIDAASKLMVRCFPPFWSKKGMEFTLGFIDELTREVPCYDLGFLPDKSVFDLIKSI